MTRTCKKSSKDLKAGIELASNEDWLVTVTRDLEAPFWPWMGIRVAYQWPGDSFYPRDAPRTTSQAHNLVSDSGSPTSATLGQALLMVSLDGGTGSVELQDVTVNLRPEVVPNMDSDQLKKVIKPRKEQVAHWVDPNHSKKYVVIGFHDLSPGSYSAIAAIANVNSPHGGMYGFATGSSPLEVKAGLLTLAHVPTRPNRPLLSVQDPLLDLDHKLMQQRRKVLATIHNQLPQAQRRPPGVQAPYGQGNYKPMYVASGNADTCTSVNTALMNAASGGGIYGSKLKHHPGFVRYQPDLLPSVGDSINMGIFKDGKFGFKHVGIIVQSGKPGSTWLGADGGQKNRHTGLQLDANGNARRYDYSPSHQAAYLVPRLFTEQGSSGFLQHLWLFPTATGGGHEINGWANITHPHTPFYKRNYDRTGKREDYFAMKVLLEALPDRVKKDRDDALDLEYPPP